MFDPFTAANSFKNKLAEEERRTRRVSQPPVAQSFSQENLKPPREVARDAQVATGVRERRGMAPEACRMTIYAPIGFLKSN